MSNRTFNISQEFFAVCKILDIDSDKILKQTGLLHLVADANALCLTVNQVTAALRAVCIAYGQDDLHIKLANGLAKGAFGHAALALQCSETLREGIHRAGRLRELFEPVRWTITETDTSYSINIRSITPEFPYDGFRQTVSFLWLLQSCRNITAKHIVPTRVCITDEVPRHAQVEQEFGCPVELGNHCLLEFSMQDMETRILSASSYVVNALDLGAVVPYREDPIDQNFVSLVQTHVLELLPSGVVTSERVAKRLSVSKRTLERRLSKQGKSFTDVVRECRFHMANHYLRQTHLPITEIAFLVGYQEVNSFYRAYKGWSGSTPQDVRGQRLN